MPEWPSEQKGRDSGHVLDDYVTWQSGGTPSKANPSYWAGSIPWVTPKDMKWFDLETTTDYLTAVGAAAGSKVAPASVTYIVVRGMILAHTFPVSQMSTPAAFNQDVKAVNPGPEVLPRFLAYWFRAHADDFLRLVGESTHGTKKLDLADLRRFPMDPPSLAEQVRLVEVLTVVDKQISAAKQIVTKMQSCKIGVLEDQIGSQTSNAALAEVLLNAPANGIYKPAGLIGRGALLVGQTAFTSDRRVDPAAARRAVVTRNEVRRFGLLPNDILVSRVFATLDGVGQPAFVSDLIEDAVFESNMMRIRCDSTKADPFFVFQTLLTTSTRAHIVRRANLSNQASISQSALTELPIWLPSLSRQRHIVEELRSLEDAICAEQSLLAKLTAERDGLLADLLTGRVRVPAEAAS
jgi:type I restriction enzyme, S subunit